MQSYDGRTAFITGGANGIGLSIARAFARAGAKIAIADIDAAALERAKAELAELTEVESYVLDVRDRESYAEVADAAERDLGPVSLLFNNAGVASAMSVTELNYQLWDLAMGINLNGVYNGIATFLPRMLARGGVGHIVNTASGAGLAPVGAGFLYNAGKYAVVGLSEALHQELADKGIGVSVLCPGPVATDIITSSQRLALHHGATVTPEIAAALDQADAALKRHGIPVDTVGEMVIDAVTNNRLYIHTDDTAAEPIRTRTAALLAAMPSALATQPTD
ncbi:SDR family NAD(P)-dependent oxidoreductase [Nocardia sp. NBC_01499]|uniref:SDR family oxidoreductase n=1 Tax=Nocardia sp. NBC_01499 TaxID=2903597 RepID=UPI0038702C5D